jgi:16S rRNA (adenine1518-N6/adenine1519-N6)-dimethyltransferase
MLDVRPKKALGQHWLQDADALESIVDSAQITDKDVVLEIGPGGGSLTRHLVKQAKRVVAVELDGQLARQLPKMVPAGNLQVIHGDILEYDLTYLPAGYKVVANIPYYLTGKLLKIFTDTSNPPKQLALLVQKEVAERLAAKPGKMSTLSVVVQLFYGVELGSVIPAKLFYPKPKVDSQVAILKRHRHPLFKDLNIQRFIQVVRAGFSARRKKLRSSLSGGLRISKGEAEKLLEGAEIDKNLRAEALSLDQWHKLYLQTLLKKDLRSLL